MWPASGRKRQETGHGTAAAAAAAAISPQAGSNGGPRARTGCDLCLSGGQLLHLPCHDLRALELHSSCTQRTGVHADPVAGADPDQTVRRRGPELPELSIRDQVARLPGHLVRALAVRTYDGLRATPAGQHDLVARTFVAAARRVATARRCDKPGGFGQPINQFDPHGRRVGKRRRQLFLAGTG